MRIFCNGCSYTFGAELKNRKKSRYSTLVGQIFNAEVVNIARRGTSLHRLMRSTYERCDPSKYDVAILQFTFPARTEYYFSGVSGDRESCFMRSRPASIWKADDIEYYVDKSEKYSEKIESIEEEFLRYKRSYYETAYTDELGFTFEYMVFQAMQDYFARHNVPLITLTVNNQSSLPFDLKFNTKDIERAKYGHPNELGHQYIAEKIASLIRTRKDYPDVKKSHLDRLNRDHKKILRLADHTDYD